MYDSTVPPETLEKLKAHQNNLADKADLQKEKELSLKSFNGSQELKEIQETLSHMKISEGKSEEIINRISNYMSNGANRLKRSGQEWTKEQWNDAITATLVGRRRNIGMAISKVSLNGEANSYQLYFQLIKKINPKIDQKALIKNIDGMEKDEQKLESKNKFRENLLLLGKSMGQIKLAISETHFQHTPEEVSKDKDLQGELAEKWTKVQLKNKQEPTKEIPVGVNNTASDLSSLMANIGEQKDDTQKSAQEVTTEGAYDTIQPIAINTISPLSDTAVKETSEDHQKVQEKSNVKTEIPVGYNAGEKYSSGKEVTMNNNDVNNIAGEDNGLITGIPDHTIGVDIEESINGNEVQKKSVTLESNQGVTLDSLKDKYTRLFSQSDGHIGAAILGTVEAYEAEKLKTGDNLEKRVEAIKGDEDELVALVNSWAEVKYQSPGNISHKSPEKKNKEVPKKGENPVLVETVTNIQSPSTNFDSKAQGDQSAADKIIPIGDNSGLEQADSQEAISTSISETQSGVSRDVDNILSISILNEKKEGPIVDSLFKAGKISSEVANGAIDQLIKGDQIDINKIYSTLPGNKKQENKDDLLALQSTLRMLPGVGESNEKKNVDNFTKDFKEYGEKLEKDYKTTKLETNHTVETYREISKSYINVFGGDNETGDIHKQKNLSLAIRTAAGNIMESNKEIPRNETLFKALKKVNSTNEQLQIEGLTTLVGIKSQQAGKLSSTNKGNDNEKNKHKSINSSKLKKIAAKFEKHKANKTVQVLFGTINKAKTKMGIESKGLLEALNKVESMIQKKQIGQQQITEVIREINSVINENS